MTKEPYCQYTIKLTYSEDSVLQKALRKLEVKNKQELQEALRSMLITMAEEIIQDEDEKKPAKKKHSARRYMTPLLGGYYLIKDTAEAKNKLDKLEGESSNQRMEEDT